MADAPGKGCPNCERLEKRLAELEGRLQQVEADLAKARKNSGNSSKPPSSDIVKPVPKSCARRTRRKRKQGAQPGHARHERPPFSPEQVCSEFAEVLKRYRIHKISGDKFGGGFPPEQFRQFDIIFEQSAKAKSDLYIDLLPLMNSQRIELLDHPRLISQLIALERRTARSGKDSIDHPPGGHDDLINSVAGLASTLLAKSDNQRFWEVMSGITERRSSWD